MARKIKFNEAIAFFSQKLAIPTENSRQIIGEAQDWAFTIAGVEKAEVLNAVIQLIDSILQGNVTGVDTFDIFTKRFNELMVSSGYGEQNPWRTRLVYKMNTRTAYNAGRFRTQTNSENARRRPYLQYNHNHPLVARPHHEAIDKMIWRADDPIWQFIYPLNGYGCNCSVTSLSERDMEREGLSVSPPITERVTIRDRLTGASLSVPAVTLPLARFDKSGIPPGAIVTGDQVTAPIAEPGFNNAPGASSDREMILRNARSRLSPRLQELINSDLA